MTDGNKRALRIIASASLLASTFDVTVTDGQLNLLFQDGGGADPHWVVNALYVRPHNDASFKSSVFCLQVFCLRRSLAAITRNTFT